MAELHRLLRRQIKAHLSADGVVPPETAAFAAAIDEAYHQFDADRRLLERSLELSSQELLQANADVRAVVQAFPDLFIWVRDDGTILGCRASAPDDLFLRPEQLIGKDICSIPAAEVGARFRAALQALRAGAPLETVEYSLAIDGTERDYEARLVPLGERQVLTIVRNISTRKRIERDLERSLALLRATFDNTGVAILVVGHRGNVLSVNQRCAELLGLSRDALLSSDTSGRLKVLAPLLKQPEVIVPRVEALYRSPEASDSGVIEFRDGRVFEYSTQPFRVSGEIAGRVWSVLEVTERAKAEQALRDSEERYRLLFEVNPQPMWVYDEETLAFLAVNQEAIRHYGYSREEFLSMTLRDLRPAEEASSLMERLQARPDTGRAGEWKQRKKDGSSITVEITSHDLEFAGRPAVLALATDVTMRKQLESHVRQSQKMEAVGRLAGGVAHDFNNILTAITGYSQMLRQSLAGTPRHEHHVVEILRAANRAAALTRQLLAFSRQQVLDPKVVTLDEVVSEIHDMLGRLIGEDVELEVDLQAASAPIFVDPHQLEQIIVNLVVNARDAMPNGGRVTIATRALPPDEANEARAMLSVTDNGCGMDKETQSKVFEPFFTTKPKGKGTGLGLATVYGIVRQSGGHIVLRSEPGRGSCFEILFPHTALQGVAASEPTGASVPGGQGTILLVEDDSAVRSLVEHLLRSGGYTVLAAQDGIEALHLSMDHEAIRLLLSDIVMPGMSGPELAEELRRRRPGLRVLLMSGYTGDVILDRGALQSGFPLLQKPFSPEGLLLKVHEVLQTHVDRQAA